MVNRAFDLRFTCSMVLALAVFRPIHSAAQDTREILTNDAVVGMVTGKLPKDITLAKIKTTPNRFDMTAGGLVSLRASKVPDDVVKAMLTAAADSRLRQAAAGSPEVLVNGDVIQMVTGLVSRPLLLEKIRSTPNKFDLTSAGLLALNQNKVPADIIKAMMSTPANGPGSAEPAALVGGGAGEPAAPSITPATRTERDPPSLASLPKLPGLYIYADDGKKMFNYVFTQAPGVRLTRTMGDGSQVYKASVAGNQAAARIPDVSAEFIFVYPRPTPGGPPPWTATASPREFALVRVTPGTASREFSYGVTPTGSTGDAIIPVRITELTTGVFRVVPQSTLPPGQYGFFVPNQSGTAPYFYEFGISQ